MSEVERKWAANKRKFWNNYRLRQAKILWIIEKLTATIDEHEKECPCEDTDLVQINGEGPFVDMCKTQQIYAENIDDGNRLINLDFNSRETTQNFVMKKVLKAYLELACDQDKEYDPYGLIEFFKLEK